MARRDHRKGLATTTISVKLTAAELEALDQVRKHSRSVFGDWVTYYETRGDALRRLVVDADTRRVDALKLSDPRQVTLTEAIEASAPAGKTVEAEAGAPRLRKTGQRPRLRKIRRQVLPAGKKGHRVTNSAIRR